MGKTITKMIDGETRKIVVLDDGSWAPDPRNISPCQRLSMNLDKFMRGAKMQRVTKEMQALMLDGEPINDMIREASERLRAAKKEAANIKILPPKLRNGEALKETISEITIIKQRLTRLRKKKREFRKTLEGKLAFGTDKKLSEEAQKFCVKLQ